MWETQKNLSLLWTQVTWSKAWLGKSQGEVEGVVEKPCIIPHAYIVSLSTEIWAPRKLLGRMSRKQKALLQSWGSGPLLYRVDNVTWPISCSYVESRFLVTVSRFFFPQRIKHEKKKLDWRKNSSEKGKVNLIIPEFRGLFRWQKMQRTS